MRLSAIALIASLTAVYLAGCRCNPPPPDPDAGTDAGMPVDSGDRRDVVMPPVDTGTPECMAAEDCDPVAGTVVDCVDEMCVNTGCEDGYDDCNGDLGGDGCEIRIDADNDNCGACGAICDGACVDGFCETIAEVSTGYINTCARLTTGRVLCWGNNLYGQVGDGQLSPRARPSALAPTAAGELITAIAVGISYNHACAIRVNDITDSAGTLWCWGGNISAELGTGGTDFEPHPIPEQVVSASPEFAAQTFTALDIGVSHTCALSSTGDVWCWGYNGDGESLPGSTTRAVAPTRVPGLPGPASMIDVGGFYSCAVMEADGSVYCWGINYQGELGNGATGATVGAPVQVVDAAGAALTGVTELKAGFDGSCAIHGGRLSCWGANYYNQLGIDDGGLQHERATEITGLAGLTVDAIALGTYHGCAHTDSGYYCWGERAKGQLGDGLRDPGIVPSPIPIPELEGFDWIEASTSSYHTCGLRGDGRLSCWGDNRERQLGRAETQLCPTPQPLQGASGPLSGVSDISVDATHGCAVAGGQVHCWGRGENGETGQGGAITHADALAIPSLTGSADVSTGFWHSCAIDGGALYCWGFSTHGQTGQAAFTYLYSPMAVTLPATPEEVDGGGAFTCARAGGQVYCWGDNVAEQLGRGPGAPGGDRRPGLVVGLSDAVQVAVGADFGCARRAAGGVVCWGRNGEGQLGIGGGPVEVSTPTAVDLGGATVLYIAAGRLHACAVVDAGGGVTQTYCWGFNNRGQLGDGTTTDSNSPVLVSGLTDASQLALGDSHSCALRSGGTVACWGEDRFFQLGDDAAAVNRSNPVPVAGLTSAVQISSGSAEGRTTCARRADGSAVCWGYNAEGVCGGGEELFYASPGEVLGI